MKERIVILGGGESGTGAAVLAVRKGYDVFVSDKNLIPKRYKDRLNENHITFEEGGHSDELILNASTVVVSPGIPDSAPVVQKVKYEGIPMVSEIEFAVRFTKAKIIGITGTNGKTTTALLTHHLLKAAGMDAGLAGNVGNSFAGMVAEEDHEYFVLELSSFQLDRMKKTRMDVAVLLNITPDHLDRYDDDMEKYIHSKFRIVRNLLHEDLFIYNREDIHTINHLEKIKKPFRLMNFGMKKVDEATAYATDEYLMFKDAHGLKRVSRKNLTLQGSHNMMNAMAAILAARAFGISWDEINKALPGFRNIPHRLELVGEIKGVRFYNDSKATNVDAVWYALESFESPVVWIAGGIDKGNDYDLISDMVKQKVKGMVSLGVDNKKLHKYFERYFENITDTDSMFRAVEIAYSMAREGDVVLLSPACASFDLFKNFEARGDKFKEAVEALKQKEEINEQFMV